MSKVISKQEIAKYASGLLALRGGGGRACERSVAALPIYAISMNPAPRSVPAPQPPAQRSAHAPPFSAPPAPRSVPAHPIFDPLRSLAPWVLAICDFW